MKKKRFNEIIKIMIRTELMKIKSKLKRNEILLIENLIAVFVKEVSNS